MNTGDTYGFGAMISFLLGWLVAQTGKLIGDLVHKKGHMTFREVLECFTRSGGMPSGHTASFVGVAIFLGWKCGFNSSIFALAVCTTIIIVYDALNVRYAVGQQGKLLNKIAEDSSKKYKKQKVIEGHTVPQAIAGAIIGVINGTILSFLIQSA